MKKYFYFRNATDEAADLTALNSVTVPVDSITGITPLSGNTSVAITFKSLKDLNDYQKNDVEKFLETCENDDDVQKVHHNIK